LYGGRKEKSRRGTQSGSPKQRQKVGVWGRTSGGGGGKKNQVNWGNHEGTDRRKESLFVRSKRNLVIEQKQKRKTASSNEISRSGKVGKGDQCSPLCKGVQKTKSRPHRVGQKKHVTVGRD